MGYNLSVRRTSHTILSTDTGDAGEGNGSGTAKIDVRVPNRLLEEIDEEYERRGYRESLTEDVDLELGPDNCVATYRVSQSWDIGVTVSSLRMMAYPPTTSITPERRNATSQTSAPPGPSGQTRWITRRW